MHDLATPYPALADLRATGPVTRCGDSSFHLVTSFDSVAEAVGRPEDFSSKLTATMRWNDDGTIDDVPFTDLDSPLHVLATTDGPPHRVHRRLALGSLSARRLARLRPILAETLSALWESGAGSGAIEWQRDVADLLPMTVVAEVVGLPDVDVEDFKRWSFASTALLDGVLTDEEISASTASASELAVYLGECFDATRQGGGARHGGDDADEDGGRYGEHAIGDLVCAVEAGEIDHDTAVMTLVQLVIAGAESTVSLIGNSVWLLGSRPGVQRELRADRSLLPTFVEEALRLESPFRGHYRHVVRDTELSGVSLTEGSHLYLSWAAANRDPARFPEPDRLCLSRESPMSHLAFGRGLHRCVGATLARMEATAALDLLLDRTSEISVPQGAPGWTRSLLVRRLTGLPVTFTR